MLSTNARWPNDPPYARSRQLATIYKLSGMKTSVGRTYEALYFRIRNNPTVARRIAGDQKNSPFLRLNRSVRPPPRGQSSSWRLDARVPPFDGGQEQREQAEQEGVAEDAVVGRVVKRIGAEHHHDERPPDDRPRKRLLEQGPEDAEAVFLSVKS
jgi:hypothetical protein